MLVIIVGHHLQDMFKYRTVRVLVLYYRFRLAGFFYYMTFAIHVLDVQHPSSVINTNEPLVCVA